MSRTRSQAKKDEAEYQQYVAEQAVRDAETDRRWGTTAVRTALELYGNPFLNTTVEEMHANTVNLVAAIRTSGRAPGLADVLEEHTARAGAAVAGAQPAR